MEITDLTNYYKWIAGSDGALNLAYQNGGDTNMLPIMTIDQTGSLTSNGLQKTLDPTDTSSAVLAQVDANGKLLRGYGVTNTLQNNFSTIQSQLNVLNLANVGQTGQISTMSNQLTNLSSNVSSLLSMNVPTQLSTLTGLVSSTQNVINILQGQNLNARVGVLENNNSVLTNSVSTINGQNLNGRLTTAEGYISTLNTNMTTLVGQNLGSRITSLENSNLDTRISQVQAVLGSISTADANLITEYNQLYAAVHTLQLQVANLSTPNASPNVTVPNNTVFYVVVLEGMLLLGVLLYLFFRRK